MREVIFLLVVIGAVAAVWFFRQSRAGSDQEAATPSLENQAEKRRTEKAPVAEAPLTGVSAKTSADPVLQAPAPSGKADTPAAKAQVSETASDWPAEIADRVSALAQEKDALLRHRLFSQLTEATYKKRKEPTFRMACKQLSQQHIEAFSDIAKPLKKSNGGKLPQVMTFQNFANLLLEDEQFEEAIAVCEKALAFGLDDKTQTGFQGRIERIRAKQSKA